MADLTCIIVNAQLTSSSSIKN